MLNRVHVLDLTTEIAGPYCTKILADAGADVVRDEPAGGDPILRHRSGALYEYLNGSKRHLVGSRDEALGWAHVVVTGDADEARTLFGSHPDLVVVCITAFGMDGPWAGRPATEFTLQAVCGSTGSRGDAHAAPLAAGGRLGEWVSGTYAAVATVAAIGIDPGTIKGRLVDVAMLDCMAISLTTYPSVWASFAGWPPVEGTGRSLEVPSVVPTKDGFAVFTTNSTQQLQDFLVMIGRPEWLEDEDWARVWKRYARRHEFLEAVHQYSKARTTAEVEADAGLYRIPAAPVLNGSSVPEFEHFRVREVFSSSASGRFRQPRVPYRISGRAQQGPGDANKRPERETTRGKSTLLPLSGIRVLDCTAWWAGPSATFVLASLGADVVKVESPLRPDAMRTASVRSPRHDDWLEWSPIFHAVNASKRGVTIDLSEAEGTERFRRLAAQVDLVVENNTPRVMEQFGLGWEQLHEVNPSLIMVRMPAFGLDGPWRDRTGFAQTMESISGMSWVTGFPDGYPVLVRGACDPVAGMHAVVATLLALRARQSDGAGRLVEVPMVESALNITAEQVIEWDVNRVILGRQGSRGIEPTEGVYRCVGDDRWVALSASTDQQWETLSSLIGVPDSLRAADRSVRIARADEIDSWIEQWTSSSGVDEVVSTLIGAGIPAAGVARGSDIVHNPQLRHRGLFELEDHPVTGQHELPTLPFRFSDVEDWMSGPAPTLGQHNDIVLGELPPPGQPGG